MKYTILTLSLLTLIACTSMNPQVADSQPINHAAFDQLLKKYVNKEGMVDYENFKIAGNKELNDYIIQLSKNGPNDKNWTKDEQLTYWINAYNALTIQLVLKYYPVNSIKDIGSLIKIPFVSTGWDIEVFEVGGQKLSLNNIEHNIIRKNFDEPRIHFALVCAAKSCPQLRNEAYDASKLDAQLTDQAKNFLTDPTKNIISTNELKLSNLFDWYGGDFTKKGSLIDYLNKYSTVKISQKASKSYLTYNWDLNKQ